jgi:biotin transport system substrate-specific component
MSSIPASLPNSAGPRVLADLYVLGFVFAAALVGWLAERGADRRPVPAALIMVLGNVLIYVCGVSVLMSALDVGLARAVALGVTPFLLTDAIKIVLASGVLPTAWRLAGHRSG